MRAVYLREYGGPDVLRVEERPDPVAGDGEVLVHVRAFGLNRSDVHLRTGVAHGVTLPIVPGIECVGVRASDGATVAAMMGGMSRTRDGSYAEQVVVPEEAVIELDTDLDWATFGALPEMLQTAYGSLTTGLDLRPGQTLLIRGGTSTIGLAAAVLATSQELGFGATVLATTRSADRFDALRAVGVEHPLLEGDDVAAAVRERFPDGVDAVLELVGTGTLPDSLAATRVHGTVCFTGMLGGEWIVPDFYPIGYLPDGVRLTAYGGEASDLPPAVLERCCRAVAEGRLPVPVHVYDGLDSAARAHADLDAGAVVGKLVVRL